VPDTLQLYGFSYQSPLVIRNLLHPRYHCPVLMNEVTPRRARESYDAQTTDLGNAVPVILACGLDSLHAFLKGHTTFNGKVLLFDFAGLLNPFFGPIEWLDCDHQPAGPWMIHKVIRYEEIAGFLDKLPSLGEVGRDFIFSIKRWVPNDRVQEIERFQEMLPKTYKDLLSKLGDQDRTSGKAALEKKRVESLKSLMVDVLEKADKTKRGLLLDALVQYQLGRTEKKAFTETISSMVADDAVKKQFQFIRRWVDGKGGQQLLEAYLDCIVNEERRSWNTICGHHGKVSDDDVLLLLSRQPRTADVLRFYESKTKSVSALPADAIPPEAPYFPVAQSEPEEELP